MGDASASTKRKRVVPDKKAQTCDTCKMRHQKCDGQRPSCYHCMIRDIVCNYSSLSAKHRGTAAVAAGPVRSRGTGRAPGPSTHRESTSPLITARLADEDSTFRSILRTELAQIALQPGQREELIQSIAQQLARRAQPPAFLIEVTPDQQPIRVLSASVDSLLPLLAEALSQENGESPQTILASLAEPRQTPAFPSMMIVADNPPQSPPTINLPTQSDALVWLKTFLDRPNYLCPIVTSQECHSLFNRFYHSSEELPPVEICLLSYVLAVGARYTDDVVSDIYIQLSHQARLQFDYCLKHAEDDMLWVLKPCLLSCQLAMHANPRLCWFALGSAIRIAQSHQLNCDFTEVGFHSADKEKEWRGLWNTIVFFDSWLSVKLCCAPMLTEDTVIERLDMSASVVKVEDSIDGNVARLSVILSRILRDVHFSGKQEIADYAKWMQVLRYWVDNLPAATSIHRTARSSQNPIDDRSSRGTPSLYLELLYEFTEVVLTQPAALLQSGQSTREIIFSSPDVYSLEQSCVLSAVHIAEISVELVRRGDLCKRSWLVTTINYHGALLLMLALHRKPSQFGNASIFPAPNVYHNSLKAALHQILQVLGYCAPQNRHALYFMEVIQTLAGRTDSLLVGGSSITRSFNPSTIANFSTVVSRPKEAFEISTNQAWPLGQAIFNRQTYLGQTHIDPLPYLATTQAYPPPLNNAPETLHSYHSYLSPTATQVPSNIVSPVEVQSSETATFYSWPNAEDHTGYLTSSADPNDTHEKMP